MVDVNSVFHGAPYEHRRGGYGGIPDVDRPPNVADCKYVDLMLSMPSYLNLSAFGVFGSSRDTSVSVAALEAVRLYGTVPGGGGGAGGGRGILHPARLRRTSSRLLGGRGGVQRKQPEQRGEGGGERRDDDDDDKRR